MEATPVAATPPNLKLIYLSTHERKNTYASPARQDRNRVDLHEIIELDISGLYDLLFRAETGAPAAVASGPAPNLFHIKTIGSWSVRMRHPARSSSPHDGRLIRANCRL